MIKKRFYQLLFLGVILISLISSYLILDLIEESPILGLCAFITTLPLICTLFNYTYKKI